MLYNVGINATTSALAGCLHESIPIGTSEAVKAGYSYPTHCKGLIVNTSDSTVFLMMTARNATAPSRASILSDGLPLLGGGSTFEISDKADLDLYLAAESAATCKGAYFSG